MALTKAEIRALAKKISDTPEQKAISAQWGKEMLAEYHKDFDKSGKK